MYSTTGNYPAGGQHRKNYTKNQKTSKPLPPLTPLNLYKTSLKEPNHPILSFKPHFWTWIPDSRPFQPVPGRKFHVESDFWVKKKEFLSPGAKIRKNYLRNFEEKYP